MMRPGENIMSTHKFSSRRQAEDALIDKDRTDGAFRAELLSNPRAAIKRQLGIDLPSDVKISVVEENARSLYLVLPPKAGSDTLSDQELATVVGGAGVSPEMPVPINTGPKGIPSLQDPGGA